MLITKARDFGLHYLGSLDLTNDEIQLMTEFTRGGCWNETPASEKGGLPSKLVIFSCNGKPRPDTKENIDFDFTYSECRDLKASIRHFFRGTDMDPSIVNWCHSSDDHIESLETLRLLSADRSKPFLEKYSNL